MKLTKSQRNVLEAIRNGDRVLTSPSRMALVRRLASDGLWTWSYSQRMLTQAGLEALKENQIVKTRKASKDTALMIAVGHGGWDPLTSNESDPFSCSAKTYAVFDDPRDALSFICGDKSLEPETVDEIFIIKNDEIVKYFHAEHWA